MAKIGDIVFVDELVHVDGEETVISSAAIVTRVADTNQGYGKGRNIVSVTVFRDGVAPHFTELDEGKPGEVGTWSSTHVDDAAPVESAPSPIVAETQDTGPAPVPQSPAPTGPPPSTFGGPGGLFQGASGANPVV